MLFRRCRRSKSFRCAGVHLDANGSCYQVCPGGAETGERSGGEGRGKGSQLRSPVPQLDGLYAAKLSHVEFSDFSMPDDPDLINTSVGSSTYGNFSNESCMIVQELEQRGFHEDCRRRLDLWVKYQGAVPQPGNFVDYEGMYFGAGGFESGNYNQHHGWVLWALAEHFLLTRDRKWFGEGTRTVIDLCVAHVGVRSGRKTHGTCRVIQSEISSTERAVTSIIRQAGIRRQDCSKYFRSPCTCSSKA